MHRTKDHVPSDSRETEFDLDALLHPAKAYSHPGDVVADPNLTLYEKRAILSSWASDASAVEAAPALREIPGSGHFVTFDEVMDALQSLDDELRSRTSPTETKRRPSNRRAPRWRWRGGSHGDDHGSPQPAL